MSSSEPMKEEADHENWLRAEVVTCPQCLQQLYRLDHAPMADDYLLYCDRCARRVEVGFYDPVVGHVYSELSTQGLAGRKVLMQALEKRIKPCKCGGHFRDDAPRRCHHCLAVVITAESGVDLWPLVYAMDPFETDITDEDLSVVNLFEGEHIKRDEIWK